MKSELSLRKELIENEYLSKVPSLSLYNPAPDFPIVIRNKEQFTMETTLLAKQREKDLWEDKQNFESHMYDRVNTICEEKFNTERKATQHGE